MEYPSIICQYCPQTESGTIDVCTGPYNNCEGTSCEEALENYNEEHDELLTMKEVF